jgi:hypothetical protein
MRVIHVIALVGSAALGAFVGGWAYGAPDSFYRSFPGVLGHWVDLDGPFNEHLIRDVGGLYLALTAASVAGLIRRSRAGDRLVGIAWAVFGALHLGYHLSHFAGFSAADVAGATVSLTVSMLLGVLLLIPERAHTLERAA